MNDYIRRVDAINLFKRNDIHGFVLPEKEKEYLAWCIERLPSADVVERKRGKWVDVIDANEYGEPYLCGACCSECGLQTVTLSNFCPDCGVNMKNDKD